MFHLPPTQKHLHPHPHKPRNTYSPRITHARRPQAKLPILLGHIIRNLRKRTHIDQAAQQALPKYDDADDVVARDEVEHGVRGEQDEVGDLEEGG